MDPGLAGLDRDPVRRRGCTALTAGAGSLGLRQDTQPQRRQLGLGARQLPQRVALLVRTHRPHGGGSDLLQPAGELAGEPQHRVPGEDRSGRSGRRSWRPRSLSGTPGSVRLGGAAYTNSLDEQMFECKR